MAKLLWIVGGVTLAVAAYVVLNEPQLVSSDNVEDTANSIGGWGSQQRLGGTGGQLKGKVKQGAGDLLGNQNLSNSGAFDQAAGAVQEAAGKAAGAVADAVRKLNS